MIQYMKERAKKKKVMLQRSVESCNGYQGMRRVCLSLSPINGGPPFSSAGQRFGRGRMTWPLVTC
jgi:hypothetical protein